MSRFKLNSEYKPTGDQPQAIDGLVRYVQEGKKSSVLQGVTGSGKTFTMANVIERLDCPTLILSHNKTLAAQLYSEFKAFFPENAVEYFVSYYDYYQPEAYLPNSDTYIEKDLAINDEIEKLRLSTTSSLLSGRRDVIVISSVSCLYGIGNPEDFHSNTLRLVRGDMVPRDQLLRKLVDGLYCRSDRDFKRGTFRVNGDTIDIFVAYDDVAYRVTQWGDEIVSLHEIDITSGARLSSLEEVTINPANIFVTTKDRAAQAVREIQLDLGRQIEYFESIGEEQYAKRLKGRVEYDLEMIKEIGYCSGVENYSRYFDGREAGTRPFCLLDYFPNDYLMFIDESHVTLPQIHGMYGGDFSRKKNLVEFGFRLPAAIDNRPLKFDEFVTLQNNTIYVSATPSDYELGRSEGAIVEQVIRPTGLLDPEIEVRPTLGQIDDLLVEIEERVKSDERVLITTITKRMAEEFSTYLEKKGVRTRYIHSDVDTMERVEILSELRAGLFDVLVGVNLLREGLDLPEVSLVAIMDADKEGFLRNYRSLTQTAGRAARHLNGHVIMYADKITASMRRTISESTRRREIQAQYNTAHGIVPQAVGGSQKAALLSRKDEATAINSNIIHSPYSDMTPGQRKKEAEKERKLMEKAAADLDFLAAARHRDNMLALLGKGPLD